MQTVTTLEKLRLAVDELRGQQKAVALVPTMGALHEGHLTLVREAQRHSDAVIVSIFVNPKQFGADEDLDAYPRQLAQDCAKLEVEGAALLWAPDAVVMYPAGFSTNITVAAISEGLCGANRPGHFDGVGTVVCKLFNQVRPDCAFFGEKDWQQLAVIRRMARDLDLTLPHADAIYSVPTVRETDGLAMSSRNAYLSPTDRLSAAALPQAMREAISAMKGGDAIAGVLVRLERQLLNAGFASVEYAQIADAETLKPLNLAPKAPARLLVAARIGSTRLIDNMAVSIR